VGDGFAKPIDIGKQFKLINVLRSTAIIAMNI